VAYSAASAPVIGSSPTAEKIQPMALLGRWATTKAPTTMKAPKPNTSTTKLAGSCWKVPLATVRMVVKTMLTTKTASIDQATRVQRLPTALPRLLCAVGSALRDGQRLTARPSRERYEPRHRAKHGLSVKAPQVSKHLSDGPLGHRRPGEQAGLLEAEVVGLQSGNLAVLPAANDRPGDLVGVDADLRPGVRGPGANSTVRSATNTSSPVSRSGWLVSSS
jgi:hypothetical protein